VTFVILNKLLFCSVRFGYFYSTSSSPLLLRCVPDYGIDTESELTRRRATVNYEWRTCSRSLRDGFKPAAVRTKGIELKIQYNTISFVFMQD